MESLQQRARALMTHIPFKSQHALSKPVFDALKQDLASPASPSQAQSVAAAPPSGEGPSASNIRSKELQAQDSGDNSPNLGVILAIVGGASTRTSALSVHATACLCSVLQLGTLDARAETHSNCRDETST